MNESSYIFVTRKRIFKRMIHRFYEKPFVKTVMRSIEIVFLDNLILAKKLGLTTEYIII